MGILKKPLLTEKFTGLTEKLGQYAFIVEKKASKDEIRAEIEKVYDVQVDQVRTMIYIGRKRSRFTKRSVQQGTTPSFKKAIVTLKGEDKIDFYASI